MMREIILSAPLSGIIFPIEEVPDPVFAQKMVGDGLSIDPTSNILCAPIDGTITQIHSALHAVTLTHSSGLEVMMHIGLDTVNLKSSGFKALAIQGQEVICGDPLIEFDLGYLATHAKSLLTQIVFTNDELIESIVKYEGEAFVNDSPFMRVVLKEAYSFESKSVSSQTSLTTRATIQNATGLHARPAAMLAALAKSFDADITLHKADASADAKSLTAIMRLDIKYLDEVELRVSGSDADIAIKEISKKLNTIEDDNSEPIPSSTQATPKSDNPNLLLGMGASPGITIGVAVTIQEESFEFDENAPNSSEQLARLEVAIELSREQLATLAGSIYKEAAIFDAHRELLDDPEILKIAKDMIEIGKSAEYSWEYSCDQIASELEKLQNPLLLERASDIRDIRGRLLRVLTSQKEPHFELPTDAILIAKEITPSMLATLGDKIEGFCTTTGGTTSHVAIIARSLGIPAVVAIEPTLLDLNSGSPVILDGTNGELTINPSAYKIEQAKRQQELDQTTKIQNLHEAKKPALTTDGRHIEIVANIASPKEAARSVELGGEGVGLLRSEFLFMGRQSAPSEQEQYEAYSDTLKALKGRPLLIRTLDVGGDKPLAYLPLPAQENPFLGQRGIRVTLDNPEIFRTQARAILRASRDGKVRIMFPMVSTIEEIQEAKRMLEEERIKLNIAPIEVGIMVEVPSVAILADKFSKEVDFFSIGTNDLSQYTLAMDRGESRLASKIDALDPSVLRLIKLTVDAAHTQDRWVGVCGNIASDPQATPILLGLGVDELSISVPAIPTIKAEVRKYSLAECKTIAQKALECNSSSSVRALCDSLGSATTD